MLSIRPQNEVTFEQILQRIGIPKTRATGTIIEWFITLDEDLQCAVLLNRNRRIKADLLKVFLERMSASESSQEREK
jgi:hypothetical protein